ncbi:MAG: FAD-dependent oxidoreductase [Candidatus Methylomirabilales bacterium]
MAVVVKKVRRFGAGGGSGGRESSSLRPQFAPQTPPCARACPNHQDVRGILTTIGQAESRGLPQEVAFARAFSLLAERNPLPASCARVCPHQCEARCHREALDGPLAINALERFLGDFALERRLPLPPASQERHAERVAVVGSGPGGLSCAYQLARRGYPVTLFEAAPGLGGMLRYGTPAFRLPREVLEAEVERLLRLGIQVRCGAPVPPVEELRRDHAAVFVGIPAGRKARLGCPGEDAPNVLSAIDFFHRLNAGERPELGQPLVVLGGGDTAIDAARTAVRLGARTTILASRAPADLPADPEQVQQAAEEGVRIEGPAKLLGLVLSDGRVTAVRGARVAADAQGEPAPEFVLEAGGVIATSKPERDTAGLGALCGPDGALKLDEHGEAALANTFAAADDLELGIVSTAIFRGRRAAEIIEARLRGTAPPAEETGPAIPAERIRLGHYPKRPRTAMTRRPAAERLQAPWAEAAAGLTAAEAAGEAARCLSCGLCFACDNCWKYCQEQAIVRPPEKGQAYRIKLEFCTGCQKCAEECPCGYIEMR